jgi:DNA repair exonuclease SbcCD ATPase subunit
MGWIFSSVSREKVKQTSVEEHIAASYSSLNAGDFDNAKTEYVMALGLLLKMEKDQQVALAPRLQALYDRLRLPEQASLMQESLKRSQQNIEKLNHELADLYDRTNKVYVNFLLKEREYSQVLAEVTKEKEVIASATRELQSQRRALEESEQPQPPHQSSELALDSKAQGLARTAVPSIGVPHRDPSSVASQMDLADVVHAINFCLEIGSEDAAAEYYEELRQRYKVLSHEQKKTVLADIHPRIRQLIRI